MADSVLPLNTGTGGKTLDTESLTGAGAVVVERQRLEVAGAALAEIARVINSAPAGTEYALVVRPIAAPTTDTTASGTIAAAAATVALSLTGQSAAAIQITGVWAGTLQFEGTVDGTNWAPVNAVVAGNSTPAPTTTANGLFRLTPAGLAQVRVNATAWTSGTATATIRASVATGGTFLNQSLVAGTNTIGSVKLTDGTNTQAITTATPAGASIAGQVVRPYVATDGTNATPTMDAAARKAFVAVTDGTNTVAVKPASTAAVAADTAQVVALHPTSPLPAGTNTIGTVTLGADPDTLGSGSITATDAVVGAPTGNGALLNGTSTVSSYVAVLCPGGDTAWTVQLTGTFGGGTVYYEASLDSTTGADGNWVAINGRQTGVVNTVLGNGTTVAGFFRGNTSGIKYFRVRMVGATTPSVAVLIRLSSGQGAFFLNASIPAGANNIGAVTAAVDTMGVAAQLSLVQSNGAPSLRVYNDQEQGMLENIFLQMQRQTELLRAILAGATSSSLSDDELDALRST